jgi:restriction endonuclease S subunit
MDSTNLQPPGDYPLEWQTMPFDDFITLKRGKDLTRDQFRDGTIPVAGSNGRIGYHDTANVKAPGVTVGRSGSVGSVTFYADDFWAHNTALFVSDFHGNDERFAAYFLDSLELNRFGSGVSVPTLDRNVFRSLPVRVPPLPEQQKIATDLGVVQRAIEQQERLVALSAELKKTLLHQLFTTGLRQEPQKQTDTGLVPESWEVRPVGLLGKVVTGSTPKTKVPEFYTPHETDFIAPADLGNTKVVYDSEKKISRAGLATIRPLPAKAVMCVCIGSSIGKVGMTTKAQSATNQQINSIICHSRHDPDFIYYLLSYLSGYWRGFATFGSVPILSKGAFEVIKVATPQTREEEQEIATILSACDAKMDAHQRRYITLTELFRTLLDQLMTAKIRVYSQGLTRLESTIAA